MTSAARENRASGVFGERVEALVGRVYLAAAPAPRFPAYHSAERASPSRTRTIGSYPSNRRASETSASEWRTSPARKSR